MKEKISWRRRRVGAFGQARDLIWQGRFTRLLGRPGQSYQLLDQASVYLEKAKAAGGQTLPVEAFLALEKGDNYFHNDPPAATGCYQHCLQVYRSLGDAWGMTKALAGLGFIAHHAGNFEQAVEIYSEALNLHRTLDDPREIAHTCLHILPAGGERLGNNIRRSV